MLLRRLYWVSVLLIIGFVVACDTKSPRTVVKLLLADVNGLTNIVHAERDKKSYKCIIRTSNAFEITNVALFARGGLLTDSARDSVVKRNMVRDFDGVGGLQEEKLADIPVFVGEHRTYPYIVYALIVDDHLFIYFSR